MPTLYLYWGGRGLSRLRYLTVVSFAKHNPDYKIKVYYPTSPTKGIGWSTLEQAVEYEGKDYFGDLAEYAELIPLDMTLLGMSNDMAEVHKSDVFRLWALSEFGGVYSDFDILYTKPLPKVKERWFCRHPDGHYAIGLLAAPKGDEVYKRLFEASKHVGNTKYQAFGATLWSDVLPDNPEGWNIPKELVYSCDWQHVGRLFNEVQDLPDEAIGLHWYGGSIVAGSWENKELNDSTISRLVNEL